MTGNVCIKASLKVCWNENLLFATDIVQDVGLLTEAIKNVKE